MNIIINRNGTEELIHVAYLSDAYELFPNCEIRDYLMYKGIIEVRNSDNDLIATIRFA